VACQSIVVTLDRSVVLTLCLTPKEWSGVHACRGNRFFPGCIGFWIRPVRRRRGRWSHSDATLYILYRESLMKYTGWYQNDFNVQG
jgi:hypothetical protein